MPYTTETFCTDYPEFSAVPASAVALQIRHSELMLGKSAWGKWYDMAQGLWVAHYLALAHSVDEKCAELDLRSPFDVGSITSQSASTSSVSVSSSVSAMLTSDNPVYADFSRTRYGMQYLTLLYTAIAPCGVVYSHDSSAARAHGIE